jgi:hypothetical protein
LIQPPPINDPIVDEEGIMSLAWILYMNQTFNGDTGTEWTPAFTNLTTVGVPTITGRYYKISQSLVYFRATIVPGTSTTSTAGTTYINNFPLTMRGDGACNAVSGGAGATPGHCDSTTNRIYVPAWTAVTVPLSITGTVEAR